ncbi:WYL domain-containing protein [Methanococcus maripaludis]|uniref:Putative DNA-binding transcriptional regulator YafY n=1 Tax=Methanococcus maripaludis TaxID=39152 RepID=A0A7J9PNR6_METMI|nr:WYL domain-containing protein [Methanococcus maripaludis]MBA2864933.1 putative DNA-binding transcriptional regulator YafY [Methanococcus maripaludis]
MVINTLKTAIKSKKTVTFQYEGLPRVVEPHMIAITDTGKWILKAFQTWTFESRNRPDWKFYSIPNIKDLIMMNKSFESKLDFEKNQLYIDKIIMQV